MANLIASRVATVVEQRAASSLAAFAFERTERRICNGDNEKYFRLTCGVLSGSDPFEVLPPWTLLRSTFTLDLANLPGLIAENGFGGQSGARVLAAAFRAAQLLEGGEDAARVFSGITSALPCDRDASVCARSDERALFLMSVAVQTTLQQLDYRELTDNDIDHIRAVIQDQADRFGWELERQHLNASIRLLHSRLRDIRERGAQVRSGIRSNRDEDAFWLAVLRTFEISPRFAPVDIRENLETSTAFTALPILSAAMSSVRAGDQVAAVAGMLALTQLVSDPALPSGVRSYLPVAAALASADSAGLATAIDAFLITPASYRTKRVRARTSIIVNAYLGGMYGRETLGGASDDVAGLFLPVGLEVSRGLVRNISVSAFFPLLDFTPFVTWGRDAVDADEGEEMSEEAHFRLGTLVSPGAYLVGGWGPVSIGGGMSLIENLREVGTPDNPERGMVRRWTAFLAVDVPLYTFR